jgi:hypothetical protein
MQLTGAMVVQARGTNQGARVTSAGSEAIRNLKAANEDRDEDKGEANAGRVDPKTHALPQQRLSLPSDVVWKSKIKSLSYITRDT